MPPSQVLGGAVVTVRVPSFSAAQNKKPSKPGGVPAPLGTTIRRQFDVEFCNDALKLLHSGSTLFPTRNRLTAIFAGATGGIPSPEFPSMCSCQLDSAADALLGCLLGTMAFA